MSISSATNRVDYTGNGAVDTYSYTFRIFAQVDLLVTVKDTSDVETTLTISTDYTVTGVGSASGGTIVLVNGGQDWLDGDGDLLTGYTLTIRRVVDLVQETDIRNQGDFYPETHEDAFDYLTMIDQQQQDELDRSVKNPESVPTSTFDPTLPTDIATANSSVVTNSDGNGFILGPTTSEISNAQTYANNASASADEAEEWANKTDGIVESTEYSAKAWAVGGTDVTDTASRGASKEWAIETSSTVDGTNYSSKEHAVGTQTRGASGGGSAKDWAQYTGGTVDDTEYSAKKYAQDSATSAAASATAAAASQWNDVVYVTSASSPVTILDASSGSLYSVDTSGGAVTFTLPEISGLSLGAPWSIGILKTNSGGSDITINRSGTDTISGDTSLTVSRGNSGVNLIPDVDGSPDDWTTIHFGNVSGTFELDDGAVGSPSLSFTSDTDTGIYNIGANELGLATGGYLALGLIKAVSGYGNVGIGGAATTSDSIPLYIGRNHATGTTMTLANTNTGAGAYTGITLETHSATNKGNIMAYSSSQTTPSLGGRIAIRSFYGDGVSLIANDTGGDIRFYNEGQGSTDETLRVNADHSIQFMQEISTPSTPASNTHKLYPKSDGKIYHLDDTGIESVLGSGSGSGDKNYLSDVNEHVNNNSVSDFVTYDDSGAYVDGTGGSPATITVSATNTSGELLEGNYSVKIAKAATDGSGEGASILTSTIDRQDYGRTLFGSLEIDFTDANYTDGDLAIKAYDVTNSSEIPVIGENAASLPNRKERINFTVQPNSDTASIRLSIHLASDSATGSAWDCFIDDIKLGPGAKVLGYNSSEWESYTPTIVGLGTVSSLTAEWKREGDSLYIKSRFTTGTTTGSTVTFDLPNGYVIDSDKVSIQSVVGSMHRHGVDEVWSILAAGTTDYLSFGKTTTRLSSAIGTTFGNAQIYSFESGPIPISGWSDSNLMDTNELHLQTNKVSYEVSASTANTAIADATYEIVDFDTQDNDDFNSVSTGASWKFTANSSGTYFVSAVVYWASISNLTDATIRLYKNGSGDKFLDAGTGFALSGSALIELEKGDYIDVRAYQDDSTSASRNIQTGAGRTHIDIYKVQDFHTLGVVHSGNKLEESIVADAAASGSADTWQNFTTLTLGPGTWDLEFLYVYTNTGTVTCPEFQLAISEYSGTTTTDHVKGDNLILGDNHKVSGEGDTFYFTKRGVQVTSPTTFYFKNRIATSLTNISIAGKATARKIE